MVGVALDLPAQAQSCNMLFARHAAEVAGLPYRLVMTISGFALAMLGGLVTSTFWFKGCRKAVQPAWVRPTGRRR